MLEPHTYLTLKGEITKNRHHPLMRNIYGVRDKLRPDGGICHFFFMGVVRKVAAPTRL